MRALYYLVIVCTFWGLSLPIFAQHNMAIREDVQELYIGILGRAADQSGLDYWTEQIANGTFSIENTRSAFTQQLEYTGIYGNLSSSQLVTAIYQNFLARAPDDSGFTYWVNELDNGRVNADQFVSALINAVQDSTAIDPQTAVDLAVLNNKVEVAWYFTIKTAALTNKVDFIAAAQASVANVTDASATVVEAKATVVSWVAENGGDAVGLQFNDIDVNKLTQVNSSGIWVNDSDTRKGYRQYECTIEELPVRGAIIDSFGCSFLYVPDSGYIGNDTFVIKKEEVAISSTNYGDGERLHVSMKVRILSFDLEEMSELEYITSVNFETKNGSGDYVNAPISTAATGVGDFNGDGRDDFAIRSISTDYKDDLDVAIIYGKDYFDSQYDLRSMEENFDLELGYKFHWKQNSMNNIITSVKNIGDYNADGYDDILLGGHEAVVLFGGNEAPDIYEEVVNNNNVNIGVYQSGFFTGRGTASDNIQGVGDVDGDGFSDFTIGQDIDFDLRQNRMYLIPGVLNQESIPNTSDTSTSYIIQKKYDPNSPGRFGTTQTGSGDVNGDGLSDLMVASHLLDNGRVYLKYGSTNFSNVYQIESDDGPIRDGVVLSQSETVGFNLGNCIGIVKDINGDGIDEMAISGNGRHTIDSDFIYLLYGRTNYEDQIDVENLDEEFGGDGSHGFILKNADVCNIESIGDINGDGHNDFVAVDSFSSYLDPTRLFVIYGREAFPPTFDLSVKSDQFFRIDMSGFLSVKAAGDVNSDGYDDFLVATRRNGMAYLIMGGESFISPQ